MPVVHYGVRIGVVSDPHGCLVGLLAALDWLDSVGVDLVVCAGDVANFGPQPDECIAVLAERHIATVRGNCDRDILLPTAVDQSADQRTIQLTAINDWGRERLTPASRAWLAALPPGLTPLPGALIVHGGVNAPDGIVTADARPIFPQGVSAVAAGHLHIPFVVRTQQGVWANAGSAGRPCDGDPRTALVILEQHKTGWEASVHRVPFDVEAAVRAIRTSGIPYAERMVETQRAACWR